MLVRKAAFERAGLARAHFDARYNLTPDEFRVEGEMIAIGHSTTKRRSAPSPASSSRSA